MSVRNSSITSSIVLLGAVCWFAGASAVSGAQAPVADSSGLQQHHPRYILHNQDVVALTFPLSPELNQTITVQPDGYVDLQGTRSVFAQGLTAPELASQVKSAYAGILHEPIVNVDIVDFQKPFFTISGQVGKPGQYDLRQDLTVAEAVAVAGGMVGTAKQQVFLLRRTPEGTHYRVLRVNLGKVLNGRKAKEVATLEPGDMIYVPEKYITNFRKYVPYSVNAGTYIDPNLL